LNEVHVTVELQVCVRTGEPPVQPEGDAQVIVLVCCPALHAPQFEYVNEVHIGGGLEQVRVRTGLPPVHPLGNEVVTVLLCCPKLQTAQSEYVNDVHVIIGDEHTLLVQTRFD
jgi:hypothetical protein